MTDSCDHTPVGFGPCILCRTEREKQAVSVMDRQDDMIVSPAELTLAYRVLSYATDNPDATALAHQVLELHDKLKASQTSKLDVPTECTCCGSSDQLEMFVAYVCGACHYRNHG